VVHGLARGALLSKQQYDAMMAPSTAGLGPLSTDKFFAYGVLHAGSWLFMNPSFGGYNGVVYYDLHTKTLVIAYATLGPTSNSDTNNVVAMGKEIASMLVPDRPPAI
jgi:D-alanyl-D-alanine carboxypeptidase